MNLLTKGLILAALHCGLVLSVTGKLLYDRENCPRVWVKAVPWDPSLPIRGRYLALRLVSEQGAEQFDRVHQQRVLFFVPEHLTDLERSGAVDIWAEVTVPRKGPPRPIRLGVRKDGRIEPVQIN